MTDDLPQLVQRQQEACRYRRAALADHIPHTKTCREEFDGVPEDWCIGCQQSAALDTLTRALAELRREVNYQRARAVDAEARLAAESSRSTAAVREARAETLKELRAKIAIEADWVYEALIIIDKELRAARTGQP